MAKVMKYTPGTWVQEFDDNGKLVDQWFNAGTEDVEYVDADTGETLDASDERINHYAPFTTSSEVE